MTMQNEFKTEVKTTFSCCHFQYFNAFFCHSIL